MKRYLPLLALFWLPIASGAVALVQTATPVGITGTTKTITFTSAVTTGNCVTAYVSGSTSTAPSSVTDSNSDTLITTQAWVVGVSSNFFGVYSFHVGTGGSSFGITVNFAASSTFSIIAFETSGSGACVTDGISAVATGTSTSPATASLTPTVTGDLQVALLGPAAASISSWGTGLTQNAFYNTTSPHIASATGALGSTSPVTASATLSSSVTWYIMQFLFKSSGGSSCTHSGITSAGALATPNGTTGSYWGKTGAFVTPDCSTVNYWQPSVGNFGVN
ncbi:MAG TPA: hypothetical protein VN750_01100 [Steroidobacteraceae bacterium]|nr:hypothetical protein [Steroidobacteraceae bacterium]